MKPLPRVNIFEILVKYFNIYKTTDETITLDLNDEEISKLYNRTKYLHDTTDHQETLQYDTDITKTINGVKYTFRIWKKDNPLTIWFQITLQKVIKIFVFNIQNKKILLEHIAPRTKHKDILNNPLPTRESMPNSIQVI